MISEYEKELEFVKDSPDDIFPDFLFNPMFNDFNDNYYQQSFAKDEIISQVKKLRRRYSDFFDWSDAMGIYEEYMESMLDKYGSMRVIKNALDVDMMPDPIPEKPKLKQTRRNKQYMRAGITPSRPIDNPVEVSDNEILAIARQVFPNATGEDVSEEDSKKKLPKSVRKSIRRMQEDLAGKDRRKHLYRSVGNNGTDFIVEYLNQTKRGIYDSSGHYTGETNMSLMDIVREQERIDSTPPEILEYESDNGTEIVNGRLVRRRDNLKLQIYKELYAEGIDVIGNFGKSMNKQAVKMVRSAIGDTEPMTKKEMKKVKKKAKKERERLERRQDSNSLLEKTLLGNKFDFSNNGNSVSFRLKDIYRD